jgi:hypothetical protein
LCSDAASSNLMSSKLFLDLYENELVIRNCSP